MQPTRAQVCELRVQELFSQHMNAISLNTDRRFLVLTMLEWAGIVATALWVSPLSWTGRAVSIHPHVWIAVCLGGITSILPVAFAIFQPSRALTRHVIAASQMVLAGMLVHTTGGRIETHFIYFGLLAFLAFYRDWKVLLTATVVTGADHVARAVLWPESMYAVAVVEFWRPLEHAGWVLFEVVVLADFIRESRKALLATARREVRLEGVSVQIASEVAARTAELADSEERYRVMFEHSPLPMWLCDARSARIVAVNDRALCTYGYTREEFLALQFLDIWVAEQAEVLQAAALLAWHETRQCQHRTKGGAVIEVEVTSHTVEWSGWTALLILANDVSDRKRAQKAKEALEVQLRQAQKLESIGQLAAGIAHEINTPTQYIGDNLHFLKDAFQDTKRVLEEQDHLLLALEGQSAVTEAVLRLKEAVEAADTDYLMVEIPRAIEQALDGTNRVSTLVKAMKEFSHPGQEGKTPANLNNGIQSTIIVARNEWKYVAELVTELQPDLPMVPCLISELNQVVLNLIVNAAHAIGDNTVEGELGRITIRTRQVGDDAEIQVEDTGAGIPDHVRDRIFDPFFTTKEVGRGSGQGLAIAHSVVVDKHQGTIRFETEVGKGTVFIISLPMHPLGQGEQELEEAELEEAKMEMVS